MIWGRVTHWADRVLIVGAGPSLDAVQPGEVVGEGAEVIALNHIVEKLPAATMFFTCDPCSSVRRLMRERRPGVTYYAAVPGDYGQPDARTSDHRDPPEDGVIFLRRLQGGGPWSHMPGLSEDSGAIHTGNSAYGALGLAYLMGAKRVALLGVDGNGQYGWGLGGRPSRLDHLPHIFRSVVIQLRRRGVEVVCGSPRSFVDCFPRMSPQEALRWLACD